MNWRKIAKYAVALFIAQFLVGLLNGLLQPVWSAEELHSGMAWMFGGWLVLFLVCSSIFAHMAIRQPYGTFAHAWLVLLLQGVIGLVFNLAITSFLGPTPVLFIAIEIMVIIAALVAGTLLGCTMQGRAGSDPADA